jgi:hypothetical protein
MRGHDQHAFETGEIDRQELRHVCATLSPVTESPFEARELVGLLADDDRRRVVAALVLGAPTLDAIRADTGLAARAAARALQRLVDAGLVLRADDGTLHLIGEAFALAARAEGERAPRSTEHADEPENVARVLRAFVHDGKLTSIPAVHAKRLVVLDWLGQRFEPGRHYSEAAVNRILASVHPDTAALRRYLVDEGILARDRGEYWRAGGTFDPT